MRVLYKMKEFYHLKTIIEKKINKNYLENVNYHNNVLKNIIITKIKNELITIQTRFNKYQMRWSIKLLNEEIDKINFYKSYLITINNNFDIVSAIKKYNYISNCLIDKYHFLTIPLSPIFLFKNITYYL